MGTIIEINKLPSEAFGLSRLLVYMQSIKNLNEPKSVSKPLAEALLACKPNRRSMKLEVIIDTYQKGQYIPRLESIGCKRSSIYTDLNCIQMTSEGMIKDEKFRKNLYNYLMWSEQNQNRCDR